MPLSSANRTISATLISLPIPLPPPSIYPTHLSPSTHSFTRLLIRAPRSRPLFHAQSLERTDCSPNTNIKRLSQTYVCISQVAPSSGPITHRNLDYSSSDTSAFRIPYSHSPRTLTIFPWLSYSMIPCLCQSQSGYSSKT